MWAACLILVDSKFFNGTADGEEGCAGSSLKHALKVCAEGSLPKGHRSQRGPKCGRAPSLCPWLAPAQWELLHHVSDPETSPTPRPSPAQAQSRAQTRRRRLGGLSPRNPFHLFPELFQTLPSKTRSSCALARTAGVRAEVQGSGSQPQIGWRRAHLAAASRLRAGRGQRAVVGLASEQPLHSRARRPGTWRLPRSPGPGPKAGRPPPSAAGSAACRGPPSERNRGHSCSWRAPR